MLCVLSACGGDHVDTLGKDTAKNSKDSVPSNIDTSKTTITTGDAGAVDNSGSGGTKIAKPDTTQKK